MRATALVAEGCSVATITIGRYQGFPSLAFAWFPGSPTVDGRNLAILCWYFMSPGIFRWCRTASIHSMIQRSSGHGRHVPPSAGGFYREILAKRNASKVATRLAALFALAALRVSRVCHVNPRKEMIKNKQIHCSKQHPASITYGVWCVGSSQSGGIHLETLPQEDLSTWRKPTFVER